MDGNAIPCLGCGGPMVEREHVEAGRHPGADCMGVEDLRARLGLPQRGGLSAHAERLERQR